MGFLQCVSRYCCGPPHGCPHRGSLTNPHLLLHRPSPPATLLLYCWVPRQPVLCWAQLTSLWWYRIAHWPQEGTLPIWGPEGQCPCSLLLCAAKRPANTHFSALLTLPPLTLGDSRDSCLPLDGGERHVLTIAGNGMSFQREENPPSQVLSQFSTLITNSGILIAISFSRREQAVILLQLQTKNSR